jgi:hypothetical protein
MAAARSKTLPTNLWVVILFLSILMFISGVTVSNGGDEEYPAPPPPVLSSDIFPCSDCHAELEPNSTRRELEFHTEIKIIGHAEHERWCLDCHDADDRDKLRLLNGTEAEFIKSYRLCGQCHGTIYKDWRAGVHGKRTGKWDGPKQYLLCTACHNPHNPRFKSLVPKPVPVRPEETLRG